MKNASINPFINKSLDPNEKKIDNSSSKGLGGWVKSFFIPKDPHPKLRANEELENTFKELISLNDNEDIINEKSITEKINDAKSAVNLAKTILKMSYQADELFSDDYNKKSKLLGKYENELNNNVNDEKKLQEIEKKADAITTKSIIKTWEKEINFIRDLIKFEISGDRLKEYQKYLKSLDSVLSKKEHNYLNSENLKKTITLGLTEVEKAINQIGNNDRVYLEEGLEELAQSTASQDNSNNEGDPFSIKGEKLPPYLSREAFDEIGMPGGKQSQSVLDPKEFGLKDVDSDEDIADANQLLDLQEEMGNLPKSPSGGLKQYNEINSSAANNIPPQGSINQDNLNLALNSSLTNFKFLDALEKLHPDTIKGYTFKKANQDGYPIKNEVVINKDNEYVGKITESDDSANTSSIIKAEFNINRDKPYYDMLKPIFMATIQQCKDEDEKVDISEFELSLQDMETEAHARQLCEAFSAACKDMEYQPTKMISLNLSPKGQEAMNSYLNSTSLENETKKMFSQSFQNTPISKIGM